MALALGYKHPDELLSSITSRQWSEWIAYYNVEPYGHDVGFGLLASLLTLLVNVYSKPGTPKAQPDNFYPKMSVKPRQSAEQIKTAMMQLVAATAPAERKKKKRKKKKWVT